MLKVGGFLVAAILAMGSKAMALDPFSCADHLQWLNAVSALEAIQIRLAQKIKKNERTFLTEEAAALKEQISVFRAELLGEAAKGAAPRVSKSLFRSPGEALNPAESEEIQQAGSFYPKGAEHPEPSRSIRFSSDGRLMLLLPVEGKTVFVWNLKTNHWRALNRTSAVIDAVFDWQDNVLVLDSNGYLGVYSGEFGIEISSTNTIPAKAMALSSRFLMTIGDGIHFATPNYHYSHKFPYPDPGPAKKITLSSDSLLAAFDAHGVVHILDLRTHSRFRTFPGFLPGEIVDLQFVPQSNRLVAMDTRGNFAVWDANEPSAISRFSISSVEPQRMALDKNSRLYIGATGIGGHEGILVVVDLNDEQELGRYGLGSIKGIGAIGVPPDESVVFVTPAEKHLIQYYLNPVLNRP